MNNHYCYVVSLTSKKIFCITNKPYFASKIASLSKDIGAWDFITRLEDSCGKQTNKIRKLYDKINKGEI